MALGAVEFSCTVTTETPEDDMARIDHSTHNHPATPAARAACRKTPITMGSIAREMFTTPDPIAAYSRTHHLSADAENGMRVAMAQVVAPAPIKMTGTTARKIARNAAKADMVRRPRAAGSSTCVQSALHTGTGRCACGWAA